MANYTVDLKPLNEEEVEITLNKGKENEESFNLKTDDILNDSQINLINSEERKGLKTKVQLLEEELNKLNTSLNLNREEFKKLKEINELLKQDNEISKKELEEKDNLLEKQKRIIDEIKEKIKNKKLIVNEEKELSFKEKLFKYTNSLINFLIGTRFITILAMLLIATTAIFFDLDGWRENYHRFDTSIIIFMIISLYIAKIAIIKILSVSPEKKQSFFFYIKHYLLSFVLLITLISMIYISFIGIYSSLAVNTTGDIKTIKILNDKENRIKERMFDLVKQIEENEKIRDSYSAKYKTLKKNLNLEIQKMYEKKDKLRDEISSIVDEREEKISGNTNKAINYSAELFKIDIGELLKLINLLMAWTLEITYLALTWYFVRIK